MAAVNMRVERTSTQACLLLLSNGMCQENLDRVAGAWYTEAGLALIDGWTACGPQGLLGSSLLIGLWRNMPSGGQPNMAWCARRQSMERKSIKSRRTTPSATQLRTR